MKIYRISQQLIEHDVPAVGSPYYDDLNLERAENYFGIGHGDFNENEGYSPSFTVWVFDGERIQYKEVNDLDEETGRWDDEVTHGTEWGHDFSNRKYKGRYEPETGQLTIVRPDRQKFREVPEVVLRELRNTFSNIQKIHIF